MRGIGKSFGGVAVLDDVNLTVAPGEVMALLGSNGAGKSTLVKILTGVYTRDAGTVKVDGEEVVFADPRAAVAAGVRLLPQEISVMGDMTVAENISLADLPLKRGPGFRVVDNRTMREKSRALLDQLGFGSIRPDAEVKRLSVAEQRIVEIARALAGTRAHPRHGRADGGADRAGSEAHFSHHPAAEGAVGRGDLHLALSERGFRDFRPHRRASRRAERRPVRDRLRVARRRSWRRCSAASPATSTMSTAKGEMGQEVLSVEGLSVPGKLEDIGLSVRAGEIVGVFGLIGSGIETLGRAIYGALGSATHGTIHVAGRNLSSDLAGQGQGGRHRLRRRRPQA